VQCRKWIASRAYGVFFVFPPKVSVIIVAYLAQDVILDCVDSLLKQTCSKEDF